MKPGFEFRGAHQAYEQLTAHTKKGAWWVDVHMDTGQVGQHLRDDQHCLIYRHVISLVPLTPATRGCSHSAAVG